MRVWLYFFKVFGILKRVLWFVLKNVLAVVPHLKIRLDNWYLRRVLAFEKQKHVLKFLPNV
jgi:hypothetical protein